MVRRKACRRGGHIRSLLLLMVCMSIYGMLLPAVTYLFFGDGVVPTWFKITSIICSPVGLIFSILALAALVVVGSALCSAILIPILYTLLGLERQAERIGLGAWQYDTQKVFGMHKGFFNRAIILATSFAVAVLLFHAWYGGWPELVELTSAQMYFLTCLTMLVATGETLVAAQMFGVPAKPVMAQIESN